MQKRFAMKLADALESGKYSQVDGKLASFDKQGNCAFCCLGVACDISGIKKRKKADNPLVKDAGGRFVFGSSSIVYLPPSVMKKYGFFNEKGGRRDGASIFFASNPGRPYSSLSHANDTGITFKEIADYIRVNYKDL